MDRLIRCSLIATLFVSTLFAQQRNAVFTQLATNLTHIPGPLLVSNNIGQVFHSFVATLGNGSSCAVQNFSFIFAGEIEASYDGITYNAIPQSRISLSRDLINNTDSKYFRASGAYPYIRFTTTHFPTGLTGGCTVNISYSGTLTATPISDSTAGNTISSKAVSTTTGCQSIIQYTSQPSNVSPLLGIVGISVYPTTSFQLLVIYTNSACSGGPTLILSPQTSGSITILPDTLNTTLLTATPDLSTGIVGFYVGQTAAGTAQVFVTTTWLQ